MSKIKDFPEKTALEVQDTDIMAIEDEEDTKKITIEALKEVFRPLQENLIKSLINETIDNISKALESAKWEIIKPVTYTFIQNTWIGSTSGNIQIALLNDDENDYRWLTREEIITLFDRDPGTYTIEVLVNHTWETPVSWDVKDFNEEHEAAHDINAWMSDDNAGFLKLHFDGLTQNEISQIIYEDIRIRFTDEVNDDGISIKKYTFKPVRDSFANSVPWESEIPFDCPCRAAQRGDN